MPRGASQKREKEYDKLKKEFKKEGRYRGREEEVASRIVNKQRSQYGETKKAKQQQRKGTNPDRDLPISNYRQLTVGEVISRLEGLSSREIRKVRDYEKSHKKRKTLLARMDAE